ncbi:MAG: sucrose-6-phosphate hydrolase [Lachnospiraceae bacterium]
MNQENLFERIRKAEKKYEASDLRKRDPYRPGFHLTPVSGWLNDPNGLCQEDGIYHVFFQYVPYGEQNSLKCWGHYTSRDLLHWTYEGACIAPDHEADKDGAYSGSAIAENGIIHIFYTGNTKEQGNYDYIHAGRGANTIHVTYENGIISEKSVVMTNKDYPSDYTCHVRDPKVWKQNGVYYMVQGGRKKNDQGSVILFQSEDSERWIVKNEVTTSYKFGYMWECPDYFEIADQKILSISPQGLAAEEFRYQNHDQSGYFLLKGEITSGCSLEDFKEWDMGFDFYAPQTFLDESGRRILYGWIGLPECEYTDPAAEYGWQNMLTMPRELTLKEGCILQNPVKEMEQLRKSKLKTIEELAGVKQYEMLLENMGGQKKFTVEIAGGVVLRYRDKVLSLEMTEEAGAGRGCRKMKLENVENLHIFADSSVSEIYVNDGAYVFTSRMYPTAFEPRLLFENNDVKVSLWELSGYQWEKGDDNETE